MQLISHFVWAGRGDGVDIMHIIGHDHYVLNDILHQNEFRPDICMACYRYLSKEDQELRQAKKKNGELFVVSQTSDKNKHRHIEEAESLFGGEETSSYEQEWSSFG